MNNIWITTGWRKSPVLEKIENELKEKENQMFKISDFNINYNPYDGDIEFTCHTDIDTFKALSPSGTITEFRDVAEHCINSYVYRKKMRLQEDIDRMKDLFKHVQPPCIGIKKVIFTNKPYTTVLWNDCTHTVVKCSEDDKYDKKIALWICYCKRYDWKGFKKFVDDYFPNAGKKTYGILAKLYCEKFIKQYSAEEFEKWMED